MPRRASVALVLLALASVATPATAQATEAHATVELEAANLVLDAGETLTLNMSLRYVAATHDPTVPDGVPFVLTAEAPPSWLTVTLESERATFDDRARWTDGARADDTVRAQLRLDVHDDAPPRATTEFEILLAAERTTMHDAAEGRARVAIQVRDAAITSPSAPAPGPADDAPLPDEEPPTSSAQDAQAPTPRPAVARPMGDRAPQAGARSPLVTWIVLLTCTAAGAMAGEIGRRRFGQA